MSYNDHRRGMHRLKIITNQRLRLVGAGVAGKKGGDPWVALRPVPLLRRPCPHGRRKRPPSPPHLSRPYKCDDPPEIALRAAGRYVHHNPTKTPIVTSPSTQTGGFKSTRPIVIRPVAETASSGRGQSRRTTSPASATRKPRNVATHR